jgi:hypothetical protein
MAVPVSGPAISLFFFTSAGRSGIIHPNTILYTSPTGKPICTWTDRFVFAKAKPD